MGHSQSIKCVKQSFFNPNIISTCGRDGLILVWDIRDNKGSGAKNILYNGTTMQLDSLSVRI